MTTPKRHFEHAAHTAHSASENPARSGPPRVALYSHDALGLGHMRRNLLIGQTLQRRFNAAILVVSGSADACAFTQPVGMESLVLPSFRKTTGGEYEPRQPSLSSRRLSRIRAQAILGGLEALQPNLLIVDKHPRGLRGELDDVLRALRRQGTRIVLGLRDILDEPAQVRREWEREGNSRAVRDWYDDVWIYGDPNVYDLVRECDFSADFAAKARAIGYIDQRERLAFALEADRQEADRLIPPGRQAVVGLVGGGEDGYQLARAFVEMTIPADFYAVLVAGPAMPAASLATLYEVVRHRPQFSVVPFVREADFLVERAERIIGMGGYNTITSVLAFRKPALIVPHIAPRREQWMRASRLAEMGALDMLPPDELSPAALSDWLARPARPREAAAIDLDGLDRVVELVEKMGAVPVASLPLPQLESSETHV